MKRLWLAALLLATAAAEDSADWLAEPDKPVSRARRLRAKADKAFEDAATAVDLLRKREAVPPEEVTKAVAALEDAVFHLERSLEVEWSPSANERAAEAAKEWYKLRAMLPEPTYETDEEKERAEREAKKERRLRLRDARRFIMDYGKARASLHLFQRCSKCDGRGEFYHPHERRMFACPTCRKNGKLLVVRNLIKGQWLANSPLYRADGRNNSSFIRRIRSGLKRLESLHPFVKSTSIEGRIEDHDTWVEVTVEERLHEDPGAKRFEEVEKTYRLYRVGRVWYLYNRRWDREALDLPEEEEKE